MTIVKDSTDDTTKHEYTALVTGFGFFGEIPITAGLIAKLLPSSLASKDPLNPSGKNIAILGPKADYAAIPAEFGTIRRRTKELHTELGSKVDLWIHLGQWAQDWVTCERRAFRQDFLSTWNLHNGDKHYYSSPDSLGKNIDDAGPNPWLDVPLGLHSEVPVDATVSGANEQLARHGEKKGDQPLRVASHFEAGAHGCGLIFYESMANCYVQGRKRDVLFVHVPPGTDQDRLEKGKEAVLAIIGSAIAALVNRKLMTKEDFVRTLALTP
ncbi:MAG: hypothetical protein GOMPHAMPRED_006933 [Gomphillus americanus]|uniref:Pyroglutamyl-peptidase I n=1 Tax=Gomphillus americanus TaxID=1940652 RepID=A0A8H3ETL2_9LECA|nr:MAG: hypothetical protein GOMPHAMPRED_006933 [Gomphillus americanus]